MKTNILALILFSFVCFNVAHAQKSFTFQANKEVVTNTETGEVTLVDHKCITFDVDVYIDHGTIQFSTGDHLLIYLRSKPSSTHYTYTGYNEKNICEIVHFYFRNGYIIKFKEEFSDYTITYTAR